MSLHGLSSKYDDMPLTLHYIQAFSQSCEKLTDANKHSDISGTSDFLIIHFKWYGIVAQCAVLFTSTHVHHTYMLYIPALAVSGILEFLDVCIFLHCLLLKVVCPIETSANFCWGRRKSDSGVAESL